MSQQGTASRFWGTVITLGIAGMSLFFLFVMMEESRDRDPTAAVFASVAAGAIFFALIRGPIGRAIGKMLEGAPSDDYQLAARIDQLEDRVAELTMEQPRVAELEERVDFTERLLSQRDAAALRRPEAN